jgi:hypothetical protein
VDDLRARGPEHARAFTWERSAELHRSAYELALRANDPA